MNRSSNMRAFLLSLLASLNPFAGRAQSAGSPQTPAVSFYDLTAIGLDGQPVALSQYKGRKIMVVNTASECGYTPQYKQLQELYTAYKDSGFVVLGFPSNDFGGQEPGSSAEIAGFCEKNYGVTFPMMAKVDIKGDNPHPVYQWLTQKSKNGLDDFKVKWNFNKFLIDEEGRLVMYLPSGKDPMCDEVLNWLGAK
jgi:glutathione peroxidase